jgi:hypothetical protein
MVLLRPSMSTLPAQGLLQVRTIDHPRASSLSVSG